MIHWHVLVVSVSIVSTRDAGNMDILHVVLEYVLAVNGVITLATAVTSYIHVDNSHSLSDNYNVHKHFAQYINTAQRNFRLSFV